MSVHFNLIVNPSRGRVLHAVSLERTRIIGQVLPRKTDLIEYDNRVLRVEEVCFRLEANEIDVFAYPLRVREST